MRRSASLLSLLLALLLVGASGYYAYTHQGRLAELSPFPLAPCSKPLAYAIGTIDPRFNLTKAEVADSLQAAASLWNDAAGKQVLAYAPDDASAMPVNLVYDSRQQAVSLGQKIDTTEANQNDARAEIQKLQQQYLSAQQAYANAVASFNTESQAYASEVARANASGGANKETYDRLNAERDRLKREQQALDAQGSALDAEGAALKAKIAAYNADVRNINQVVTAFNSTVGGDFEEGQYVRDTSGKQHIDIYAYKSHAELIHSLAHEFGHSLGLEHNENPVSIMFPYNKNSAELSADDLAALKAACKL